MKKVLFALLCLLFLIVPGISKNKEKSLEQLEKEYAESQKKIEKTFRNLTEIKINRKEYLEEVSKVVNYYSKSVKNFSIACVNFQSITGKQSNSQNSHLIELDRLLKNISAEINHLYPDEGFKTWRGAEEFEKLCLEDEELVLKEAFQAIRAYKRNS